LTDQIDGTIIYEITYDPSILGVSAEEKEITDGRLLPVWGKNLTRLVFTVKDKSVEGNLRINLKKKKD
jgi:hypothetical protein